MKQIIQFFLFVTFFSTISYAQNPLANLIGKSISDDEPWAFRNSLGSSEVESFRDIRNVMFLEDGVEVVFNAESEKITGIFLMGPNNQWYTPYKGNLPEGLTWNMTRAQVEEKIGKGVKQKKYGNDFAFRYQNKFIELTYNTEDDTDMNATIKVILIAKEWD